MRWLVLKPSPEPKVFMSHRNARLNVHGRRLLVHRVRVLGWAVAHAAKAQGVSRQCAHRWIVRYDLQGEAGLYDRSSRPHHSPRRTTPTVEERVVALRREQRRGQDWLGPELGVAPRTVSRILRRHHLPYLRECDPLTGTVIRSSKTTAVRYERDRPGELVPMDVKKIGKIPDGGGWRAHGRGSEPDKAKHSRRIGYDYIHSMVDDHSRLAYCEILPDEKGATCAGFLARAAVFFAGQGIDRIEQVMTDNHFSYRHTRAVADVIAALGPGTCSSARTAPGKTAKSNGSTAPCKPSWPTGRPSHPTPNAPKPLRPGSRTTTLNDATPHWADCPLPCW